MRFQIWTVRQLIPKVISRRNGDVKLRVLAARLIIVENSGLLVSVVVDGTLTESSLVIHLCDKRLILVMVL